MNERIKSLIERAEYQAQKHSGSDWEVHVKPSREQILEKFAELIVKECVRYFNEDYVRDFDTLWREDLSAGLKGHFGVDGMSTEDKKTLIKELLGVKNEIN